jgi:hypothetical protein
MNFRTLEILADWKPAILDGKVRVVSGAAPPRKTVKSEPNWSKWDQALMKG